MSNMKHTRKLAAIALGVLGLATQQAKAVDITVGGNIQLVSLVNAAPELGLDFTSVGTGIRVATFTITSNARQMDVIWAFGNGGRFENATTAQFVQPTNWYLTDTFGTTCFYGNDINPATAAGAPVANALTITTEGDLTTTLLANASTATTITFDGGTSTASSNGCSIVLSATWAASTNLAGLYTETITTTMVPTL